jgi:hypothetical protein
VSMTWQIVLALFTILIQVATAAYVYGRLTERVRTLGDRTVDHGRRITNLETVTSGVGGHGERITAIEAWRLEHLRKGPNT